MFIVHTQTGERTLTRDEMLADESLAHFVNDTPQKNDISFAKHEDALNFFAAYNPLEARQKIAVDGCSSSTGNAVSSITFRSRICSQCSAGYGNEAMRKPDLRCGQCKNAWYCGSVCQRTHWKFHKRECKQYMKDRVDSKK
jgi:hypothetical protein